MPKKSIELSGDITENGEIFIPDELPLLPVRDVVIFTSMILPLFVGRDGSVAAVEAALAGNRLILIATQRDQTVDDPKPDDIFTVGTVAMIMRMVKLPDGRLKGPDSGPGQSQGKGFSAAGPHVCGSNRSAARI